MKKRLFISSILMTLVLLVAITTATFAWYSAGTGNGLKSRSADATSSVSTATTTFNLQAGTVAFSDLFDITVVPDDSKGLELAHYAAGSSFKKLYTGYLDSNRGFHEMTELADGTNNLLYKQVTVTVTLKASLPETVTDNNLNVWSLNDALGALYGTSLKFYVDPTSDGLGRAFNTDASECKVQTAGADTEATDDDVWAYDSIVQINSGAEALTQLITRSGSEGNYTYSKTASASITYTFYVYVWGGATGASGLTPSSGAQSSGNFRVTVQDSTEAAPAGYTAS